MKQARPLAWLMLAVWTSWLSAAQALLVSESWLSAWTPDFGLLLLIACAGSLHIRDVPLATVVVVLGRLAHTVEPPPAVVAGFLSISVICQVIRRVTELGNPAMRFALGGLGSLSLVLWLALVHALRTGAELSGAIAASLPAALATGLSTGLLALAFQRVMVHLPGLTPLRERRW